MGRFHWKRKWKRNWKREWKRLWHLCLGLLLFACHTIALASASTPPSPAKAQKYASIIIDADSLEILHARNIDQKRYPASLTKMMTLYLTFEALDQNNLDLDDMMPVSQRASKAVPVKLGLKSGDRISVRQAIKALSVRSANDVSVVLAEHIGGSVEGFAKSMNAAALALGMKSTQFKNPHGLPDPDQYTTARDMIKLASAHLRQYPHHYHFFSTRSFVYKGRTFRNHNTLLGTLSGVDGFKTGYTDASGYNLIISAKRDNRRIIAGVLGGASGTSRDQHMNDLVERGFEVITKQVAPKRQQELKMAQSVAPKRTRSKTVIKPISQPLKPTSAGHTKAKPAPSAASNLKHHLEQDRVHSAAKTKNRHWAVQLGAYRGVDQARLRAQIAKRDQSLGIGAATVQIMPITKQGQPIFRARLTGLPQEKARSVCNMLATRRQSCLVIAPH